MDTDDKKMSENREEKEEEKSFAELLEESLVDAVELEPGQKVEGTVLKIGTDWVFLDVGQKGEGVLDKAEMVDDEGGISVAEGDSVIAYFLSRSGGELRFTTRIGGEAGQARLEEAWRSAIPVEGFVAREIKGGFEVRLPGNVRAFCPHSQIDLRRSEAPEEYLEKHFTFRITRYEQEGRNIVLSRRVLQEEARAKEREKLRETLTEGLTVNGTISSIRDFGAFVDIGGIEGLLPISEVGWGRVEDIREVLGVGQQVEVAVIKLDWEAERFTFSLRQTLADPWQKVPQKYPEGSVHRGTVARLATFGAFVTLEEGIDGLIHISRLGGGKRLSHPREVVREGEELEVRIEKIDSEARRISLVPAEISRAREEEEQTLAEYRRKSSDSGGMGTLGDLLKAKLDARKKRK